MRSLVLRCWRNDGGAIIAAEYLFIATTLVVGIVVGLSTIRDAVTNEMVELANSYMALSQGYIISGQSGCCAATDGSMAIDTNYWTPEPICSPASFPHWIDRGPGCGWPGYGWANYRGQDCWPNCSGPAAHWMPER